MSYKIIWTPEAQKDLAYWKQNNKLILKRIFSLVEIVKRNPSFGIGKPERLKYKEKIYGLAESIQNIELYI